MIADERTLDLILREARSHGDFLDKPVPEALLREAHDLMRWGPTTANSQPMRVIYLRSQESREKLRPALSAVNAEKTMKAPVVGIVAYDTRFWEHLPRLYHNPDAINWYNKPPVAEIHGFRNGSRLHIVDGARRQGRDGDGLRIGLLRGRDDQQS